MNAPPSSGKLVVTVNGGDAIGTVLQDPYDYQCTGWVDDVSDMPLLYRRVARCFILFFILYLFSVLFSLQACPWLIDPKLARSKLLLRDPRLGDRVSACLEYTGGQLRRRAAAARRRERERGHVHRIHRRLLRCRVACDGGRDRAADRRRGERPRQPDRQAARRVIRSRKRRGERSRRRTAACGLDAGSGEHTDEDSSSSSWLPPQRNDRGTPLSMFYFVSSLAPPRACSNVWSHLRAC